METAQALGDKGVELLGQCIERFLGFLSDGLSKVSDKMSELGTSMKSSVKSGLESMRHSPSATPSLKPDITPSMAVTPEISAPSFSQSPAIQSALAGVGFSCVAEDLGNASVGENGVGCAAQTYARYQTQSMQLGR